MRATRISLGILLLVTLAGLAAPLGAAGGLGQVVITSIEPQGPTFPFTNTLLVSVADTEGLPILNLDASAFSVLENETRVEVAVSPYTVTLYIGFVFDTSKSMNTLEGGKRRVDQVKEVATALIDPSNGRLKLGDKVAVFAFSKGKPALISDFDVDHNRVLDGALPKVDTTGNAETALFDIMRKSVDEISRLEARRVLLLFSDGMDITSSTELDEVILQAKKANVVIYAVGMGSNMAPEQPGSRRLRRLAQETGGQYWAYQPGKPGVEMSAFLDGLVAQRNLYRMSFTSTQCSAQSQVRVIVEKDGIKREASQSYLVPELEPEISLEGVTASLPYSGRQLVKVSIVCSQYPVTKVEFRLNDRLVYTDNASPFEFEWNVENTARELGATSSEPKQVKISAVAYAGKYTVERSAVVAAALSPVSTSFPIVVPTASVADCSASGNPLNDFVCRLQHVDIGAWLAVISPLAVLVGVIWLEVRRRRNALRGEHLQLVDALRRGHDPYIVGAAIEEPGKFYGRQETLAELMRALEAGNHMVLHGERRIGKTSFLHQLAYHLGQTSTFIPVFIQMQQVEQARFFFALMNAIAKTIRARINVGPLMVDNRPEHYDSLDMADDLEIVLDALRNKIGDAARIVLLLDEADKMNSYNQHVQEALRGLLMTPSGGQVKLVWSGKEMNRDWKLDTSPWYNLFKREIHLGGIDKAAAERLIRQPVKGVYEYDDTAVERILKYSDYKPFQIQRLCAACVRRLQDVKRNRVTVDDVDAVYQELTPESKRPPGEPSAPTTYQISSPEHQIAEEKADYKKDDAQ